MPRALLLPLLLLTACAPQRDETGNAETLLVEGGDDPDAWFAMEALALVDGDGDGRWSTGETLRLTVLFENQRDVDHMWYPGMVAAVDSEAVQLDGAEAWWYGIVANESYEWTFGLVALEDLPATEVVRVELQASSLACGNGDPVQEAEFCPDPNPLVVPIVAGDVELREDAR